MPETKAVSWNLCCHVLVSRKPHWAEPGRQIQEKHGKQRESAKAGCLERSAMFQEGQDLKWLEWSMKGTEGIDAGRGPAWGGNYCQKVWVESGTSDWQFNKITAACWAVATERAGGWGDSVSGRVSRGKVAVTETEGVTGQGPARCVRSS